MRSTLKNSTPVEAASRRRAYAERLAVYHLEAALLEQARLGDAYNRALDTSAEQSCFLRLEAASLDVSRCDLAVKGASSSHA